MRRLLFPLILGLAGVALLTALGTWQLQRLEWKQAMLAAIEARIDAPAMPLPPPGEAAPRYTPVRIDGRTSGDELHVLTSRTGAGPGYRVIAAFATDDGRRILLDRGFIPEASRNAPRPAAPLSLRGHLDRPEEADHHTPPPEGALWFARDVPAMAAALGTEPLLVVAADTGGNAQGIAPLPVGTAGIPNNHLNYAITWFSLAVAWAGMTLLLLWRIRQRTI